MDLVHLVMQGCGRELLRRAAIDRESVGGVERRVQVENAVETWPGVLPSIGITIEF